MNNTTETGAILSVSADILDVVESGVLGLAITQEALGSLVCDDDVCLIDERAAMALVRSIDGRRMSTTDLRVVDAHLRVADSLFSAVFSEQLARHEDRFPKRLLKDAIVE